MMPRNRHESESMQGTAASQLRVKAEREVEWSSGLREYAALFATVSVLCERFSRYVRTRSGRAHADRAKTRIEQAMNRRHNGDIDRAIECLRRAVVSIEKGDVVEETFGPRLDQLWHGYDVVAQGVEAESEAHECLERFVVAVDMFNDATVQDDTDYIVDRYDMAIDLLKRAALARHRR